MWLAASPAIPGLKPAGLAALVLVLLWGTMLVDAYRSAAKPMDKTEGRPWLGALLSTILPGLGHFFVRAPFVGALFLILDVANMFFLTPPWVQLSAKLLFFAATFDAYRRGRRVYSTGPSSTRTLLWVLALNCIVGGSFLVVVRTYFVQPFKMPTGAMQPTLQGITKLPDGKTTVGDHIFVDKLSYRFRLPQRGEIVVFRTDDISDIPEKARGKYYIKRIVGLPGERISIEPPFLLVNGQRVHGPPSLDRIQEQKDDHTGYVLATVRFPKSQYLSCPTDSVQLGPDEYFVLGDNSRSSFDSRYWGPISGTAIVGRATKVYWPFNRAGITFSD